MEVLILDDHKMMAQAIAGVLAEIAGLEVLGICCTPAEACELIRQRPPRLLVLDAVLGGENYRDAVDLLHTLNPSAELLFITALGESFTPPADLAPITIGVLSKTMTWDALLSLLRHWWQALPDHRHESLPGCEHQLMAIDRLSPREQRLLRELGNGQLNKQIAARLELSPATVESYRKSVAAKLGISGAELVRLAVLYRCLKLTTSDSPSPPCQGHGDCARSPRAPQGSWHQ